MSKLVVTYYLFLNTLATYLFLSIIFYIYFYNYNMLYYFIFIISFFLNNGWSMEIIVDVTPPSIMQIFIRVLGHPYNYIPIQAMIIYLPT